MTAGHVFVIIHFMITSSGVLSYRKVVLKSAQVIDQVHLERRARAHALRGAARPPSRRGASGKMVTAWHSLGRWPAKLGPQWMGWREWRTGVLRAWTLRVNPSPRPILAALPKSTTRCRCGKAFPCRVLPKTLGGERSRGSETSAPGSVPGPWVRDL